MPGPVGGCLLGAARPCGQVKLLALHHGLPDNKAQGSTPLPAPHRGPQGDGPTVHTLWPRQPQASPRL